MTRGIKAKVDGRYRTEGGQKAWVLKKSLVRGEVTFYIGVIDTAEGLKETRWLESGINLDGDENDDLDVEVSLNSEGRYFTE